MARLMRAYDWSQTPLGAPDGWSQSLRTCVRIMLNTRHPVFLFWGEEAICLYNDAYRQLIGPERHAIALGNRGAKVWAEIWDLIGPQIDQVMAGGEATWYENHLIPLTRNGQLEQTYWTYSYSPVDDETSVSGIGGALVLVSETSKTVLAEQQKAAATERFIQLFDQAPTFIAVLNGPEHRFEFTNPGYQKLVGDRQVVGLTVRDAVPEATDQGYVALLDTVYETGEAYTGFATPFTPEVVDGQPAVERFLDFVYQPIKDAGGAVTGIMVVGVDQTERTVIEAARRASEESFREIANAAPVLIWISDTTQAYTWFNKSWLDFVGRPLEDELGNGWIEHVHPDDRDRCLDIYVSHFERREPLRMEYKMRRYDGTWRIIDDNGVPRFSCDGTFLGYIGSCVDVTDQRDAEQSVRNGEEQLRLATEAAEIALFDYDTSTGTLFWTPRLYAMYGMSGTTPITLEDNIATMHPDDRDFVVRRLAEVREPSIGVMGDLEYRTVGKEDGVVRWVQARGRGIFNSDGTCSRVVGTAIDITSRKEAELRLEIFSRLTEEIRDLEDPEEVAFTASKLLGESLGLSRVGYGTLIPDTDLLSVDRDWVAPGVISVAGTVNLRHFGDFIDDLNLGKTVAIADVAQDVRTSAALTIMEAHSIKAFIKVPLTEKRGTVALLFLNCAEVRDWSPEDTTFIEEIAARIRTAVERVTAVKALQESEARLRDLNEDLQVAVAEALAEKRLLADVVESTDSFIQVVALNFDWMAINRASADEFERIFGVRPKAGDNMLEVLKGRPDHQAAIKAVWSRALTGEPFTQIDAFGAPDLDRRYYEMKFNPLRDDDGNLIGAYQFVYDVTERLRDQARLADAEDQLRQSQKMEAVGQLTGGIAHDFNNMLAVVLGSLELVKRRIGSEDQRTKRQLEAATEAAKRAANLTQRLLVFSRQQPLRPETTNANKLILGMSDLLHHSIGADIRLETVLSAGLWKVHIDPNQLENVILNLAVNARDAMPGGGRITIETQNVHLDGDYVARAPDVPQGHYIMISVTDTGTGMSAEVITKAFDPYFTTKEVGKGTGLGLSQVYGFVNQSGGHVKIVSEINQGTSIKIYLPRVFGAETEVPLEEDNIVPEAVHREAILVVDDEPAVRQFSVDALTELGYVVFEAESAAVALTTLKSHEDIELLFTDIVMPDTNGRKLADAARIIKPRLKVLYTTGYTRNAVVHNGIVDPGVELIGKPFTLDELAARVREVLDTANVESES